jgi:adenylate cyclase
LEWFFAQQKAKRLQHLFQGYLPASVMAKLLKENNQQVLLPQRKHLTILFADIEDFTKRAENSEPEEIAQLTQQILEQLTQAIYRHQGTVDKYMGDAVMAFWNAPLEQEQHADLALAAAQDILQSMQQFNQQHPELNPAIKVRIGINSGDVIVGDLGTSIRHSYTALGDAVNVASRLQELAKETPYCMLLSQYVVEDTTLTHTFYYVDKVKLRGKSAYEKIYTLQSPKSICSLDKN